MTFKEMAMGLRQIQSVLLAAVALGSAASPASAQQPVDNQAGLPGVLEQSEPGTLRCPDGSTRPWKGEQPASALVINMACAVPPEEAERRTEAVAKATAEHNAEAEQRAALRGDAGFVAGAKASVETGSLDYLLSFRIVWLAIVVGGIWLIGTIIGRVFRGGR